MAKQEEFDNVRKTRKLNDYGLKLVRDKGTMNGKEYDNITIRAPNYTYWREKNEVKIKIDTKFIDEYKKLVAMEV